MIKNLIKFISFFLIALIIIAAYLSFFGFNTKIFNNKIETEILKFNKKINLELKNVKFLLNPYNFTAKINTKDSVIFLDGRKLQIQDIKTNISLKSLIYAEFSIDNLQILTKPIKLNDLILLMRSLKNSTELFLLDKIIKEGLLTANINLNFDKNGKIKNNYKINGLIENGKLNFLNQYKAENINFNFNASKNRYLLTKIKTSFNGTELSSPLIEINQEKDLYLVSGKILTRDKNYNTDQLSILFTNLLENISIKKIKFSSINDFSFDINKKIKLNNLKIKSKINLNQLTIRDNFTKLKNYLPNLNKTMNFVDHKIMINYDKNKLDIIGNGKIVTENEPDSINYKITKENEKYLFDLKIKLKNNKLLIDFLDYEKEKGSLSSILIKGKFKKNNKIKFDLISMEEKKNKILIKNLIFNKNLQITNIDNFDLNYLNNKNLQNKLILKKKDMDYTINGESFDITALINKMMNNNEEKTSLFSNINSKIHLNIDKLYIDETNFLKNLSGSFYFENNKIDDLDLKSIFQNDKKINLSIKTNIQQEQVTKLFTDYPKPLIKRYKFINGFEEGYLDYYSIKKNGITNSSLIIDDFKIKEVPVLAKLLSLASLQGISDLLTGEGIRFTDFEMKFSTNKKIINIKEMYAIGPAVSILMDGYIEGKKLISLRGTLVPATTINRSIASIPILGDILIGKKTGEGVFGVSFKIKGPPNNLKTTVNPIKSLTPRFITRTLEKIKKN